MTEENFPLSLQLVALGYVSRLWKACIADAYDWRLWLAFTVSVYYWRLAIYPDISNFVSADMSLKGLVFCVLLPICPDT